MVFLRSLFRIVVSVIVPFLPLKLKQNSVQAAVARGSLTVDPYVTLAVLQNWYKLEWRWRGECVMRFIVILYLLLLSGVVSNEGGLGMLNNIGTAVSTLLVVMGALWHTSAY